MFANAILVTKRTVALTRFTARMVFTRSVSQNVGTILTLRRPVPTRHVSMANGMYFRGHKYVSRYAGQKPVLFLNRPSEVQVAHSVLKSTPVPVSGRCQSKYKAANAPRRGSDIYVHELKYQYHTE